MPQSVNQTAFTQGEISPAMYGRVDFQSYFKGLRTCRNFIVSKYGGVDNRPGTRFVGAVDDSTKLHRFIRFQFNNQQQYVLVLGDYTMQIVANGAFITGSTAYIVTGYVVTTPYFNGAGEPQRDVFLTVTGHSFSTADTVNFTGVSSVVNGPQLITKIDANTLKITFSGLQQVLAVEQAAWTGSGFAQEASGSPVTVVTPWPSQVLNQLKFTQSADVVTVCHPLYPTQQIERLSATIWQCVPFVNVNGPFLDINPDNTNTIFTDGFTGSVAITSAKDLFDASMVGELFYIQQAADNATNTWQVGIVTTGGSQVKYGANYYQAASSGTTGTIPPTVTEGSERDGNPGVLWTYLHSGFGIVKITAFTDSKNVIATVVSRLPDSVVNAVAVINITNVLTGDAGTGLPVKVTTQYPNIFANGDTLTIAGVVGAVEANGTFTITIIDNQNFYLNGIFDCTAYVSGGSITKTYVATPTYNWAKDAWGTAQGYPATTAYFQDRQLFGGSNGRPSTVNFSRVTGFTDFAVGNPTLDDDAITYKILSNQANTIKHMLELSYLIIFTSGGPYMVQGGAQGEGVTTPSTIMLKSQGNNPVSDVAPLKINSYALFIHDNGKEVRTLGYSFAENSFIGKDVTVMSSHLMQFNRIVNWAYQRSPYSCIWAVRDDGVLLGFTFEPEQEVTAWHHHDTQGKYEDVCCVTENNEDVVYFLVNRTLGGQTVRCIERMVSRQFQDQRDGYFVDCGLTYDGRPTNTPATTFSGLDHLNGETAAILADGNVYPQQVVVAGSITLPNPSLVVHIGLPYVSDLETLDIAQGRDKKKAINAVSLIVDKSSGFTVGPDANNLQAFKTRANEDYSAPDDLISDIVDTNILATWLKSGRIFVRQSQPLPCSILAVIPQVETGGF